MKKTLQFIILCSFATILQACQHEHSFCLTIFVRPKNDTRIEQRTTLLSTQDCSIPLEELIANELPQFPTTDDYTLQTPRTQTVVDRKMPIANLRKTDLDLIPTAQPIKRD